MSQNQQNRQNFKKVVAGTQPCAAGKPLVGRLSTANKGFDWF